MSDSASLPPRCGLLVTRRAVRPHHAVVPSPALDQNLRLPQRVKELPVEQFVPEIPVERLQVPAVPGAPPLDVQRPDADLPPIAVPTLMSDSAQFPPPGQAAGNLTSCAASPCCNDIAPENMSTLNASIDPIWSCPRVRSTCRCSLPSGRGVSCTPRPGRTAQGPSRHKEGSSPC